MPFFSIKLSLIDVESGGLGYRSRTVQSLRDEGVPEADILASVKAYLKIQIDEAAEARRLQIITPGAGQAAEYQQVQAEAVAALAKPTAATADKFPMLAASIGVDIDPDTGRPAADVLGVARSVQAAAEAWKAVGAFIRRVRLAAKAAIDAAATLDDACAALDAVRWTPATAA